MTALKLGDVLNFSAIILDSLLGVVLQVSYCFCGFQITGKLTLFQRRNLMRLSLVKAVLANVAFVFLLLVGLTLIFSSASAYADAGCSPSPDCFPPLSCSSVDGGCVTPNYDCGGPCPGAPTCNSWGDPCTCYWYSGRCSVPMGYVDGIPQYLLCTRVCCDTIMYCF